MGVMKYILPNGTVNVVGKGIKGDDGKSAFQYAKDGGYTGTEAEFAEKLAKEFPTKLSSFDNDSKFITASGAPVQSVAGKTGTVTLAKGDVGLGDVDNVRQYSASNPPPYPVDSVNGKAGAVTLTATDVGAHPKTWMPTAEMVGAVPEERRLTLVGVDENGTEHTYVIYGGSSNEPS